MRCAVLLNPFSGGAAHIQDAAEAVSRFLAGHEAFCSDAFGGALLPGAKCLHTDASLPYVPRLYAAIDALTAESPELWIVGGGDGMAAYLAGRLLETGCERPRIAGIAMGTANVGPIVSIAAEALAKSAPERLIYEDCGAIEAFDGETHAAYGFNDVVLGDTLLATVEGKPCTVSAKRLYAGATLVPAEPAADIGALRIMKNGALLPSQLGRVSQVIVSCVERENLYGRAVSGMLCFTAGREEKGALLLSERPLVTLAPDARGYESLAPSEQLLFAEGDRISISGLAEGVMLMTKCSRT